jgi:hypothetical protein
VLDARGRVLASGTTDADGRLSVQVPGSAGNVTVKDVTDNDLMLGAG